VDLVVVNLYPFAKAASNPETPFDELVEQIDIGGPSLLRAAAKNFRDVLVVVDPAGVPARARAAGAPGRTDARVQVRADAEGLRAHGAVRQAHRGDDERDYLLGRHIHPRAVLSTDGAVEVDAVPLRYGENPHQAARWRPLPPGLGKWEVHQGKALSYTNLLDLDAALRIVLEFTEPAATVIKHTNPCGTATGESIAEAYVRARDVDPLSAFGGIVGINRPLGGRSSVGDRVHVHRSCDRTVDRRCGERDSGEEGQPSRRDQRVPGVSSWRRRRDALPSLAAS